MAELYGVNELFHFLTPQERELLLKQAEKIKVKKNQILTRQGEPPKNFFLVLKGKLRVTKHAKNKSTEHTLAYLQSGETIGELALIDNSTLGFTLTAVKSSTLLKFNLDEIKQYPEIHNKLSLYLTRRTVKRLRRLSEVTVKSMQKELEEAKKHRALGLLMVTVLSLISVYMLSLRFLQNIKYYLPITTIISAPMVIIIVAIMLWVMKRSGFSWRTYGISFRNWRRHIIEAVLFSIPVIIILMAAKWLVIHWALKDPHLPLIDPRSSIRINFTWTLYFISLIIYILLVPLQELIVRGALQSGFNAFLLGKGKSRVWIAIIISNLMFSLPHLYDSIYFALIVLIPGFFWGWLFARQKTLVGVCISHILIGVWMVFIVGFEQLIARLAPPITIIF